VEALKSKVENKMHIIFNPPWH